MSGAALGQRLKIVRDANSCTQAEFAHLFGVSLRAYSNYENDKREPEPSLLQAVCERYDINPAWLLTGEGRMKRRDVHSPPPAYANARPAAPREARPAADPADYVALPLYEVQASAGGGIVPDTEQVVDFLYFKRAWVRTELRCAPDDLYLIYIDGESMEPTLRPGDVILVNHRDQSQTRDGIYVLRLDGALLVKRLQRLPGGVIKVTSDNLSYAPFEVATRDLEGEDMAIIGRVVWAGRRM